MMRPIAATIAAILLTGCETMPPTHKDSQDILLLARANDGSKKILARESCYQYNDGAALSWVHLFVTEKGVYSAYWDQYNGVYGLALRLKNAEIASVTHGENELGFWKAGKMLVIKNVYGNEFGCVSSAPITSIELALKQNREGQ